MQLCKTVTVGVIAYNEHPYLPSLLENVLNQSYPKNLTEVILVDGCSTDDTKAIMQNFREKHEGLYRRVEIFDNPARIQPSGWNIVLENASSDVIVRIDAHAIIPSDFIEKNMECINSGEDVCGGPRENIIDENTPWKRMLLAAEQSLFGSGGATYRQDTREKKYVKSVFHGAYRKEVLEKVGLFNDKLMRTEDNEYHYRIREAGYRICYSPLIQSKYQTRNSLRRMIAQKYKNGEWVGRTLFVCPKSVSFFHLIPGLFVAILAASMVLAAFGVKWLLLMVGISYLLLDLLFSVLDCCRNGKDNVFFIALPIVFFLLHLSYGSGTIIGTIVGINKVWMRG